MTKSAMVTAHTGALWVAMTSLLLVSLLTVGCAAPVPLEKPTVEVPSAFKEYRLWKVARTEAAPVSDKWWLLFNDPVLNDLHKQLVVGNETLKVSAALVQSARAALSTSRSAASPSVSANAGVTSSVTPGGIAATTANSLAATASWELDLWGRVAGAVSSAESRLIATTADLSSARLSVQALLTQTYLAARSAEAQGALLERSVTAYQRSLELTQNRYNAGVASAADVAQATTQLRTTQVQLIESHSSRAQLEHAIASLLGKPAASFTLTRTAVLPVAPAVPVQLPSDLLERRPDIAAASARVAAAQAQVGVAQSAFFPSITLSATAGFRNPDLLALIDTPSLFWSLGPSLALALLDGGARTATVESAKANTVQAAATYRQTVLTAFQEVEDNLVLAASLAEQIVLQTDALTAAQRNLEITNNQYKAGTVSYLNVVAAQTSALSAERNLLDVRNRRLAATGVLLKNLGGRWDPAR